MKKGLFLLFLLSLFFNLISCTTLDDSIENIQLEKKQEQINNIVNNRIQIRGVEYRDYILQLIYNGGRLSIDARYLPFLCVNDSGNWTVNGVNLSVKCKTDSKGTFIFPSLIVSSKRHLLLDDKETSFSWDKKYFDDITFKGNWICAIAQLDYYLCLYYFDGEQLIIPIAASVEQVVPDYFFGGLVEKERNAEDCINSLADDESSSYVFFTDAHWEQNQKHSPAIIKHIIDYTPLDRVIFGGDANTNRTDTAKGTIKILSQFREAFNFLGPNLYCLIGNHDDNSTGQVANIERHLSEAQVYACLQSQMSNVFYWGYYNFYFDDPISRTRYLCFDTGRFHSFRSAISNTARFAIESLLSVPDNWHIVAASHLWTTLKNNETSEIREASYVRPLIEVLENYNLRKKATFVNDGMSFDYDFSSAGATIEYCIGGHTHVDAVIFSSKGLPLINVTCDGQQSVGGLAPYTTGTKNEQCVTIVVNDYKSRQVNIYHIGRGTDVSVDMWKDSDSDSYEGNEE